ncbi:MAG: AraC family transcriptional regulator [Clostridiales bacterium]|nr:AraC family transcriptional regulator [Clostridiales bacterium]
MARKKLGMYEYRYYDLPEDFPVMILKGEHWKRQYNQAGQLHFHNHLEIGICLSGSGFIRTEEKLIAYEAGCITFIPAQVAHATVGTDGMLSHWEYLFLDVAHFLELIQKENRAMAIQFEQLIQKKAFVCQEGCKIELGRIVNQIVQEMFERKHFYREAVKGLITPLLIERFRLETDPAQNIGSIKKQTATIESALSYIHANYRSELKIGTLAELCHMSEVHFRRIFFESTGETPLDYINGVRIKQACQLLLTTQESVSNIGNACGFQTSSTFGRNFLKKMGTTPLKWKNECKTRPGEVRNYEIKTLYGWMD